MPATIEGLPNEDFHNMDRFIALVEGHEHSFIDGLLEALSEDEEMSSMMFAILPRLRRMTSWRGWR